MAETPPITVDVRSHSWTDLDDSQREAVTDWVRSLGLDPDFIEVDFVLTRYGPGPWHLHLTEFERNENGVASRAVVRQVEPPAFLLTTSTEEPS